MKRLAIIKQVIQHISWFTTFYETMTRSVDQVMDGSFYVEIKMTLFKLSFRNYFRDYISWISTDLKVLLINKWSWLTIFRNCIKKITERRKRLVLQQFKDKICIEVMIYVYIMINYCIYCNKLSYILQYIIVSSLYSTIDVINLIRKSQTWVGKQLSLQVPDYRFWYRYYHLRVSLCCQNSLLF